MTKGIGRIQTLIGVALLDYDHRKGGADAHALAKAVYEVAVPTKSQNNVCWAALNGMERRSLISYTGKHTIGGWRRWVLTSEGRSAFEPLRQKVKEIAALKRKRRKAESLKVVK